MRTRLMFSAVVVLALSAALPACSNQKPEPEIASSSGLASYAKGWPTEMQAAVKGFADRRAEVRKLLSEAQGEVGKLRDIDTDHALEVVNRADEDGRGQAYVDRARRVEAVEAFFDAEKDDINRKVSGSVIYSAKKKGCDAEVGNSVGPAIKDAVDKSLDKELDEASEAQQLVDRYKGELGKENTAALGKVAANVSGASYLVHVRLVEDKQKVQRMVVEADHVKRTADDAIEAEKQFQAGKKVTDAEKKASQARIEEMNKAKAAVDGAMKQAEAVAPAMADEIQKIQKEYDDALDALKSKIKDKKKAS